MLLPVRDKEISENLGLVHSCANRFRGRGIEYEDLYQAGCMGLVKAYDAFDSSRGVKFSTYAVPVILGEIKRLFRDGGAVKVSRGIKELSLKVTKERLNFIKKQGREPKISELSAVIGQPEEHIAEAISASVRPVSLTLTGEDDEICEADIAIPSVEEDFSELISIKQVLNKLDEQDRELIRLRYFCDRTQSQTGKELKMTQVQVSRREKKILAELKKRLG